MKVGVKHKKISLNCIVVDDTTRFLKWSLEFSDSALTFKLYASPGWEHCNNRLISNEALLCARQCCRHFR